MENQENNLERDLFSETRNIKQNILFIKIGMAHIYLNYVKIPNGKQKYQNDTIRK